MTARSLAARRLAEGEPAIGRSFRLHRPRGAFCHGGWCQQCRIALPSGEIALACRTGAERAGHPAPTWKRWLARLTEALPPWFYEHRLLRPRALRQFYLRRLRQMSAAPPLPAAIPTVAGHWRRRHCDVLVVGGGLAGLAAAAAAIAAKRDVLLVEAEALGGRACFQPNHRTELAAVRESVPADRVLTETLCLGLYDDAQQALLLSPEGPVIVAFDRLVVATGAYDRLPNFTGNDLPGIVGVRAFERLMAAGAIATGTRVGLFGHPTEIEAALATGHRFAWMAGPSLMPPHLAGAVGETKLIGAVGAGRLRAAMLDPGGERPCDLLVLGFSQPSYELQAQAGAGAVLRGSPAAICMLGPARIELEVVGDATLLPAASAEAACRSSPDAFVCLCEDVRQRDLAAAIAGGHDTIELLKRRTGAGTGPCQGKLCHAEMLQRLAEARRAAELPTMRPLMRPVSMHLLAAADDA